ncbi:hypothetical protein HUJ04_012817 [Dendroctonus ponderosae]|nr:hypothetical protein HUJ04_012817 [Dendroctonus ponderosae]
MRIKRPNSYPVLRILPIPPRGHREFHKKHKEFCEHTLTQSLTSRGISPSASCPSLADVDSYPASKVLPFLYLGNSKDAADLSCLEGLGTTCVLNVTSQLPGYHEERGITYKQIPATDSGHQNLKQYFEEAFEFIDKRKSINLIDILLNEFEH